VEKARAEAQVKATEELQKALTEARKQFTREKRKNSETCRRGF